LALAEVALVDELLAAVAMVSLPECLVAEVGGSQTLQFRGRSRSGECTDKYYKACRLLDNQYSRADLI